MKHFFVLGMLAVLSGCAATATDVQCVRHLERINPVVGAALAPTAVNALSAKAPVAQATVP